MALFIGGGQHPKMSESLFDGDLLLQGTRIGALSPLLAVGRNAER
jgi:hypothetical protein